jgi:hypothetical protein
MDGTSNQSGRGYEHKKLPPFPEIKHWSHISQKDCAVSGKLSGNAFRIRCGEESQTVCMHRWLQKSFFAHGILINIVYCMHTYIRPIDYIIKPSPHRYTVLSAPRTCMHTYIRKQHSIYHAALDSTFISDHESHLYRITGQKSTTRWVEFTKFKAITLGGGDWYLNRYILWSASADISSNKLNTTTETQSKRTRKYYSQMVLTSRFSESSSTINRRRVNLHTSETVVKSINKP